MDRKATLNVSVDAGHSLQVIRPVMRLFLVTSRQAFQIIASAVLLIVEVIVLHNSQVTLVENSKERRGNPRGLANFVGGTVHQMRY